MRILFAEDARRIPILITSVIVALFLAPSLPTANAQQDDKDAVIKLLENKLELQRKEFDQKLKTLELTLKQQQLLHDRLKQEIDSLNKSVNDRENLIVKLEADLKIARDKILALDALAKARQIQAERLLEELREKPRLKKDGIPGVEPPLKSAGANPPAVKIVGKIVKAEGPLVQINLGTDNGLKENNTLHVYRLEPEPKYLGMIRIVDAGHTQSVGRIVQVDKAADLPKLKEGDQVASHLKAKEEPKEKADAATPNPPAVAVQGKITKVDGAVVEISLGKDHGLQENHTLDVIRLQPAPKYLGIIRIVSVANTTAMGRMIGANPPALKEGDTVTSKLK